VNNLSKAFFLFLVFIQANDIQYIDEPVLLVPHFNNDTVLTGFTAHSLTHSGLPVTISKRSVGVGVGDGTANNQLNN